MSVGDTAASSTMAKNVGDPAASSVVNTASSVAVPASNAASSSVAVSASSRAASASGNHPGTKLPPRSTSTQSAVDFEFPLLDVGSYHTLRDLEEEKSKASSAHSDRLTRRTQGGSSFPTAQQGS